jgi:histidine decarboxylase
MYGLHLARELHPDGIVYYSSDTHYSIPKAIRLLRMRSQPVLSQPNGEIDYSSLRHHLTRNKSHTVIIIANIGTTMTGAVDSLPIIRQTLTDLQITNHYIHCDAALSGMILPFVSQSMRQPFGFDAGASSLSISGHKMIGSPIPCGVVLTKRQHIDSALHSHSNTNGNRIEYAGILDTTLLGSRSGFTPLLLHQALTSTSNSAPTPNTSITAIKKTTLTIQTQVDHALVIAAYAVSSLRARGVAAWRHSNSVTVVFPCPNPATLKKWQIASQGEIAHLVAMPSVTREMIDAFVAEYEV